MALFAKGHKLAKGGKRQGSGRKKLTIHQLCAVEFEKRIPILCKIADDEINRPLDRIAAIKELARVGVPTQLEVTGKDGGAVETKTTVTQKFDYEGFRRAMAELRGGAVAAGRLSQANGN